MFRALALMVTLAIAALAPVAGGAVLYNVTDLGATDDASGRDTLPLFINNAGQVTGVSGVGTYYHAFRWTGGVMQDLGHLGGNYSEGHGINSAGVVVGNSNIGGVFGTPHAFRWSGGTMQDLGTLGGPYSFAYAINDAGQVAGSASISSGPSHAFLWQSGVMTDLGALPGVPFGTSRALAMNGAGVVVGHAATANYDHAVLWRNGQIQDLGTLGFAASTESWARAINDNGMIVGHSTTSDGRLLGFVSYNGVGNLVPLGTLAGDTSGSALGVNLRGEIVGNSAPGAYMQGRAVLWQHAGATPLELNTLIPAGTEWFLLSARSINDAGQIVGIGYHGTAVRGFLLTPIPEPALLAPLALAACVAPSLTRRRH